MSSPRETIVNDEVEALQAIYGAELVSFRPRKSDSVPASVSISLQALLREQPHRAGNRITLSALLPDGYPDTERPLAPTLRADGISAAICTELVDRMLNEQSPCDGQVCLFQYCSAMIEVLDTYAEECTSPEEGHTSPNAPDRDVEAHHAEEGPFLIFHGEPLTDRKSVFQAHAAHVTSVEDIDKVLVQLRESSRKVATATHNTLAYRIQRPGEMVLQDFDDDGEKGAGKGVLYVLQQLEAVNLVCIISRWFGGTKLGPVRFKHINRVSREVVEAHLSEFRIDKGSAS